MSLRALLDEGAVFDCEYRGGLSNHRPMALTALKRLGAGNERLRAFADAYSARLEPAPPAEPWPGGDPWPGRLGDRTAWPAYRTLFGEWFGHEGRDMLPPVLATLLRGCGAAAFHGLIRTAYGLQAGHVGETVDGLAYWACRWLPLDGTPPPTDTGLIFEQMQAAASVRGFEARVDKLPLDGGTLERLARDAAALYAVSGNFTVLHLVTSAHALRSVLGEVEDPLAGVAAYRRAWVAGRAASGARTGRAGALLPWDELVAAALVSADDHLVKLVDSCREETAVYGGDEWQRAASRAVTAERLAAG